MRPHKILPTLLFIAALTPTLAAAQDEKTVVMVETDPMTFALDGFATHIRFSFPGARQWTFGAGLYGMEFPSLLVDLNADNKDEGWNQRLKLGYGLFVDHYFNDGPQGFFVGAQVAIQRYEISQQAQGQARSQYANLLIMPRAGYLWKPFEDNGFYLMPWLGLGGTAKIAGDAKVGTEQFEIAPVLAFATLHAGWQF